MYWQYRYAILWKGILTIPIRFEIFGIASIADTCIDIIPNTDCGKYISSAVFVELLLPQST